MQVEKFFIIVVRFGFRIVWIAKLAKPPVLSNRHIVPGAIYCGGQERGSASRSALRHLASTEPSTPAAVQPGAAVNAPQSRRFARFSDVRQSRSVWSASGFCTAFRRFQCATSSVDGEFLSGLLCGAESCSTSPFLSLRARPGETAAGHSRHRLALLSKTWRRFASRNAARTLQRYSATIFRLFTERPSASQISTALTPSCAVTVAGGLPERTHWSMYFNSPR